MGAELHEHVNPIILTYQKRYTEFLAEAYKITIKNGWYVGMCAGFMNFVFLCDYALAFWYGSVCIS